MNSNVMSWGDFNLAENKKEKQDKNTVGKDCKCNDKKPGKGKECDCKKPGKEEDATKKGKKVLESAQSCLESGQVIKVAGTELKVISKVGTNGDTCKAIVAGGIKDRKFYLLTPTENIIATYDTLDELTSSNKELFKPKE